MLHECRTHARMLVTYSMSSVRLLYCASVFYARVSEVQVKAAYLNVGCRSRTSWGYMCVCGQTQYKCTLSARESVRMCRGRLGLAVVLNQSHKTRLNVSTAKVCVPVNTNGVHACALQQTHRRTGCIPLSS